MEMSEEADETGPAKIGSVIIKNESPRGRHGSLDESEELDFPKEVVEYMADRAVGMAHPQRAMLLSVTPM